MGDLRDILSENDEHLNEDELLRYLEGTLSQEDKDAFEKKIEASGFVNDAVDGLKTVKDKQHINDYVHQLNKNLEKQLALKKHRKEKRTIKNIQWVILTALIIFIICIIAFLIIRLYRNQ